jgi:pimeloyl-ACP methyl ester carboxylesterase
MGYSSIQGTRPQIPGGGHFAALEQPDLFVAELRKSLAQVR